MRPFVLSSVVLAICAIATPGTAQTSGPIILPDATLLDVTAVGRVSQVPDIATIRAGVVSQSPTAAAALSDNAQRMAKVLAALKRAGVAPRDVATSSVQLAPQYRYADNQPPVITGYQASNTVSVRFRDIARSGRVLDALVREGANQIDGPTLSLDKPEAALDTAREDAVRKARARAEIYARASGMRVERIASISENGEDAGGGPPPVVYRARMVAAAADSTPVLAGETDVTVTLSVRFILK